MRRVVLLFLLIVLTVSCNPYSVRRDECEADYDSVVFIGVDGVGSYFESFGDEFEMVFNESSAFTFHATSETPSVSAENWGSYLHGVSPAEHKCTNGSIACERFPYRQYPSVFKIIRDIYPSSSLVSFSEWNAINYGLVEPSAGVRKSSDKRFCSSVHSTSEIEKMTLECLDSETPKFLFVHLENADAAGHSSGYGSEKYLEEVKKNLAFIREIDKKIDYSRTLLIVATDHGGIGDNHGGNTKEEMDITIAVKGYTVTSTKLSSSVTPKDIAVVILKALGIEEPDFMEGSVPEELTL